MKIFLTLLLSVQVQASMNDLFYFPEKSKADGATSLQLTNSDVNGNIAGLNFDISTTSTSVVQAVAFGLTDELAIGLNVPYVLNGSLDLNLAGLSTDEDYQTGFQSLALSIAKRTAVRSLEHPLSYFDVRFFVVPANNSNNTLRSDYMGVSLFAGTEPDASKKLRFGLGYNIYNATADVKEQTLLNLNAGWQQNLDNGFLYQLGVAILQWSDQEFKNAAVSFEYSYVPAFNVAFGRSIAGEKFDWLVSYDFYQSALDISAAGTSYGADTKGSVLSLTAAYRF